MKYKVMFFRSNYTMTTYFTNLDDATTFAETMNGIVLNAKGVERT